MRMIMALVAVAVITATAASFYPASAAERCGNFEGYPGWAHDAFCRGQQGGGA